MAVSQSSRRLMRPLLNSPYRPLLPLTTRIRHFSTSRKRPEENTYFPRRGTQTQQQPPVVVVQTDPSSSSQNHRSKHIRYFILGLASFPVLYLTYKAFKSFKASAIAISFAPDALSQTSTSIPTIEGTLGLGSAPTFQPPTTAAPPESQAEFASLLRSEQEARDLAEFYKSGMRDSDRAGVVAHRLLVDLLTAWTPHAHAGHTPVKDTELLQRPPVPFPPDAQFLRDPAHAQLIRLVDGNGQNRVLILAVDFPASAIRDEEDPWERTTSSWRWLYHLADELHHAGANAETNIPLYLWTRQALVENSLAAERPNFLQLYPADMPPGFPMKQVQAMKTAAAAKDQTPRAVFSGNVLDLPDGLMLETADEEEEY